MKSGETGHRGEAAAAQYYLKRGCSLLAHNYRTRMGELDLILLDGQTVVICEVKTRSDTTHGSPAEAVDAAKRHRIVLAAKRFLQESGRSEQPVRFDVAEVRPAETGWLVHCIRNAFEAT